MKNFLRKLGLARARKPAFPYRFSVQHSCPELAADLATPVPWRRATQAAVSGETAARFLATPGAHKWHHYFPIYDSLFPEFRDRPIRLLEIGVYKGGSLQVWRDYFHKESTLVGIDIDPGCAQLERPLDRVHVRIGPQQDKEFLAGVVREFGPFDLIIDDGSHVPSHMIASFNHLFDTGLRDGGLYFAEDTHTNYWSTYRDGDRSFMDFCAGLVDCLHAHYAAASSELHFRVGGPERLEVIEVPRITTLIDEIRFFDSVVAIRKSNGRQLPQSQHW